MALDALLHYNGTGKPEKHDTLETGADPITVFTNAFHLWVPLAKSGADNKALISEAMKLLSPHNEILPDIINDEYVSVANADIARAPLFFTALLNLDAKRRVIVRNGCRAVGWGSWLQRGILELYEQGHGYFPGEYLAGGQLIYHGTDNQTSLGEKATAGCVINNGNAQNLGREATGGIFINYTFRRLDAESVGRIIYRTYDDSCLGTRAKGGIFVNYGTTRNPATGTSAGLFINFGQLRGSVGRDNSNGVYIDCSETKPSVDESCQMTIIGKKTLLSDRVLAGMIQEMRHLTQHGVAINIPAIEALEQRITASCKEHYA
ncbi:hypothetical protein HY639_03795 [Candidatus Woesearchaeota archaeon]|nr:hypothetical protein [Candidatus Woesearchaeota archaeon]